jgi:hypothetical protein
MVRVHAPDYSMIVRIVELKNSVLAGESTNPKASWEYSPLDDLAGGQEECSGLSGDVHQLGHSE